MLKIRLIIKIIAITFITVFIRGCSEPDKKPQIILGTPESALSSIIWLAEERDLFNHQGINVKIQHFSSGKEALAAMLEGKIDLAATAETPFAIALFNHKSLRLFASIGQNNNEVHILARKDHGIFQPKDLRGKIIATQKGSAVHFFLSSFLMHHKIDNNSLDILFMDADKLPQSLIKGEIDAFSLREPYLLQVISKIGHDKLVKFSVPGLYTKTYNIVGDKNITLKHPGVVGKLLLALSKAAEFRDKHPLQARQIISEKLSLPLNQTKELLMNMRLGITLNQSLVYTLEEEARWAIDTQLVKSNYPGNTIPDILNFIDARPLANTVPGAIGLLLNKTQ